MKQRSTWPDAIEELIPGIDPDQYADAWGISVILWRGVWNTSRTDWSRYRRRIWEMYANWLRSAARRGRNLENFLSEFAKLATLPEIGSNNDERKAIAELLTLPPDAQRRLIYQFRENTSVIVTLLRLYRDQHKAELEARLQEEYEQ